MNGEAGAVVGDVETQCGHEKRHYWWAVLAGIIVTVLGLLIAVSPNRRG